MLNAVHAASEEAVNDLPSNARNSRHGQSHVQVKGQSHASQRQHKHAAADGVRLLGAKS